MEIENKFKIAYKCESIILALSDILELVPKKFYYEKNKTLEYIHELLETVYLLNFNYSEAEKYASIIYKDIRLIDFQINFFIHKKLLSRTNLNKVTHDLVKISKMTSKWISNIRTCNNDNRV